MRPPRIVRSLKVTLAIILCLQPQSAQEHSNPPCGGARLRILFVKPIKIATCYPAMAILIEHMCAVFLVEDLRAIQDHP